MYPKRLTLIRSAKIPGTMKAGSLIATFLEMFGATPDKKTVVFSLFLYSKASWLFLLFARIKM